MFTMKFSSMTHAGKAYAELSRQGVQARIEKGTSSGCAFRIRVDDNDKTRAMDILRRASVPFTLL